MACCNGINKDEYINGSFKTNHNIPPNQASILKHGRLALWNNMHPFRIHNITVSQDVQHIYMDNETFEHRKIILNQFENIFNKENRFRNFQLKHQLKFLNCLNKNTEFTCDKLNPLENTLIINSILEYSELVIDDNIYILNSSFKHSKLKIGPGTYISDLKLVSLYFLILLVN